MSNGDATFRRWITRSRFRGCPTRRSRSEPGLCPCTRRAIAKRAEPDFELLRYILGGNRPSQTDRLTRSRAPLQGFAVRQPDARGWYLTGGSAAAGAAASKPPTYAARGRPDANVRLQ